MKAVEDRQFARFRLTGSPRALGAVYDRVAPELLRVAGHLASDPAEAEDLVQRTFVTAIEKSRSFDGKERVLPWLLGILAFHAKNEKRRSSRRPDPARLRERIPGQPDAAAESEELSAELDRALEKLPREQRSVLTLRLRHHLSVAEIAHALDRPAGTVRSQLARGMESLRTLLPAGLVASATLALGLPLGLQAIREGILKQAAASPLPKLVAAKGYCALALAPVAEVVLMKKAVAIVAVLVGALLGTRALLTPEEVEPAPALQPVAQVGELPVASLPATVESSNVQASTHRLQGAAPEEASVAAGEVEAEPIQEFGSLEIRVLDHLGNAVPGEVCLVTFPREDELGEVKRVLRTDARGEAHLQQIPVGFVRVQPLRGEFERTRVWSDRPTKVRIQLSQGIDVHGKVIDSLGNAVPHAQIWLSKPHHNREGFDFKRANGAGEFHLKSVRKDNYIAAHAPGFGISYMQAPAGTPGGTTNMRIMLDSPGGILELTVLNESGEPVVDAEVAVGDLRRTPYRDLGNGTSGPPPPARRGRTNEAGKLTLTGIPAGTEPIWVRARGLGMHRGEVPIQTNSPAVHTVSMLPEAIVSGRTIMADGSPTRSASIWTGTRYRFNTCSTIGKQDGLFRLAGLPHGEVVIHAEVPGLGSTLLHVSLMPGEEREVDLIFEEQPPIMGRLTSFDGSPLDQHTIVARTLEGREAVGVKTTNKKGEFRLIVEEGVPHELFVYAPGEMFGFPLVVKRGVKSSPDTVHLTAPDVERDTASLRVPIQHPDGLPCEGVTLQIRHEDLDFFCSIEEQVEPGVFELTGLLPGSVKFNFVHPDYQTLRPEPIEARAGEWKELDPWQFAPVSRIVGRLNGLKEETLPANSRFNVGQANGGFGSIEITGSTFRSTPLAPGKHHISLLADRYVPIYTIVELQPGEERSLTLDLIPSGLHLVRVRPAEGDPDPQWVSAIVNSPERGMVWSGVFDREEDGSYLARVSALPGRYQLEVHAQDERKAMGSFEIRSLVGDPRVSELTLDPLPD